MFAPMEESWPTHRELKATSTESKTSSHSREDHRGVCIVVPAYNEGPRIYAAASQVLRAIERCGTAGIDEIVLIDDSSTDITLREMNRFLKDHEGRADMRIVSLPINRGVGNALLVGVHSTTRQSITLIPGDGVFLADGIKGVLELRDFRIVLSDRRARHKGKIIRRALSKTFAYWFSWLVRMHVPDPHSMYLLPSERVGKAAFDLWGEWNPHSDSRLDNDYHLDLLATILWEEKVGAVVGVNSSQSLESNSQVFRPPFLGRFARNCLALSLMRLGMRRTSQPRY